ncbi:MAG: hypothetical protein QM723_08920 [Myxococcaceae bacterium]
MSLVWSRKIEQRCGLPEPSSVGAKVRLSSCSGVPPVVAINSGAAAVGGVGDTRVNGMSPVLPGQGSISMPVSLSAGHPPLVI